MRANPRAKVILKKAYSMGMDDDEIAALCGVAVGSVKRWNSTGRADSEKIKQLEQRIGFVQMNELDTADALIEIYIKRKKRFRLTKSQFLGISGRRILRFKFFDLVKDCLIDRGYLLLDVEDPKREETIFAIIRQRTLAKFVSNNLTNQEIEEYLSLNIDELWEESEEENSD